MASFRIFLIAFAFAVTLIISTAAQDEVENADEFVDQILESVRTNSEIPIDPIAIPDRVVGFNRKVLGIDWKGEMRLHEGVLTGLSTISRTGPSTLKNDGTKMIITVVLGMGVLNGKTTANIHFMNLGPSVTFLAKIGFAEIDLGIEIDLTDEEPKPKMTNFKLRQLKGLQVSMTGLGPLNYLFNFFSTIFTSTFRFSIKFVTEKIVANIVQKQISEAKLPF